MVVLFQGFCELAHPPERLGALFHLLVHVVVAEVLVHLDERIDMLFFQDIKRLCIEEEACGNRETDVAGNQGAEMVREFVGQHGEDACCEVYRSCPEPSFVIYDVARVDVVCNICDMDPEFNKFSSVRVVRVTGFKDGKGDGIIEILGIRWVDGVGFQRREVTAAFEFLFPDCVRKHSGSLQMGFLELQVEVDLPACEKETEEEL